MTSKESRGRKPTWSLEQSEVTAASFPYIQTIFGYNHYGDTPEAFNFGRLPP